jgi:uncharacterized protein (DUF433 family)
LIDIASEPRAAEAAEYLHSFRHAAAQARYCAFPSRKEKERLSQHLSKSICRCGFAVAKMQTDNPCEEAAAMDTKSVEIVDIGRGPQIAGHRLTVLDVFYYLHRGHEFDFIHRALPTLSREQFDAIVEYVNEHHDELVEKDRRAEEFIRQGIAAQKAKGHYREIDESIPVEERARRLKEKMKQRQAEKNGDHASR